MKGKRINIDLKHLLIEESKFIGLKYYPNPTVDAIVGSLNNVKWSDTYSMNYIPNNKENLDTVFKLFKGVAWINSGHFFNNKPIHIGGDSVNMDSFRQRIVTDDYRTCPEDFFRKLEIKKYSLSTAKTYISLRLRLHNSKFKSPTF